MKQITRKRIEELKKAGHVVHEYPRKKQVCVDGFKYFQIAPQHTKWELFLFAPQLRERE